MPDANDPWAVVSSEPVAAPSAGSGAQSASDPWSVVGQEPVAKQGAQPTTQNDVSPSPYFEGDPNLSLGDLGQAGRGAVAGVVGIPGDMDSLGLKGLKKIGMAKPGEETLFPTTSDAEKWFAPAPDQRAQGYRTVGEITGSVAAPYAYSKAGEALAAAPGVIARAARPVGEAIGNVMPGATARAGEAAEEAANATANTVSEVGPATDRSVLGKRMMQDLRPDYDDMYTKRQSMLAQTAAAHDAAEKAAQFRGVYDDPILGQTAQAQDQAARRAAFSSVYQDPQFADLRTFEANPLGKAISADTTEYGGVPKLDPYDLPPKAFRSADSVQNLRQLLGGYGNPQEAVESYAGEYASQSLKPLVQDKDAASAAKAVRQWVTSDLNRAWLNETPATKQAVMDYAQRLQATAQQTAQQANRIAKTQRIAKTIAKPVAAGIGLGAGYDLYHGLE